MPLYQYPEFHLLSEFLKKENLPDAYPIGFREESEADNRFALSVTVNHRIGRLDLPRKLAMFWGCPGDEWSEEDNYDHFEASDNWHGDGEGNLRELADEIAKDLGEGFFDVEYTVGEIHKLGGKIIESSPSVHSHQCGAHQVVTCVYCGLQYPEGTPTSQSELLTAHIKVCDKHPMRAAEERIAALEEALVNSLPYITDILDNPEHLVCFKKGVVEKHHQTMRKLLDPETYQP